MWRLPFIQTVLGRDLPQFAVSMPATALVRLDPRARYLGAI